MDDDGKREEIIGRIGVGVMVFWRLFKRFVVCSLAALVLLLIFGKPLWLSPLIGLAAAIVWTEAVRLFYRLLISFGRNSGD